MTAPPPNDPADLRPVVLVLGDFAHEGLTAKIESLGFAVLNKRLRSSPSNWGRIVSLIRILRSEQRLPLVFGYIPTPTLLLLAEEKYDSVRPALLAEFERTHTILFVYEDNLQGSVEPLPWETDESTDAALEAMDIPWVVQDYPLRNPTPEEWKGLNAERIDRARQLLQDLSRRNLQVAPFRKRSDVTLRMFEALEDVQAGVFLRLYVPHGRYQSEQFEDFLTLFARYLREAEGREFSVDVHRTARGTTYIFKGRGEVNSLEDLRDATQRFDHFLVLAQADPKTAEAVLTKANVSLHEASFITAKYARSFRRLHMEMRHEFERRRLLLTQGLEADMLDVQHTTLLPMPDDGSPSTLFSVIGNTAPVTISLSNVGLASQGAIDIGQLIAGGIRYSTEDRQLLSLLEQVEDKLEALRLRSELDRLKDPATPPAERRTAVQKLKTFLYSGAKYVGRKVDEVGTKVLVTYLEGHL